MINLNYLKLQKKIIDVLAGVIISGGFIYLISNGFLLEYWVKDYLYFVSAHHIPPCQIRKGKLNTLVNKFMAFSRVMGMVYISTLMLGQVVSTYYGENEVNWR